MRYRGSGGINHFKKYFSGKFPDSPVVWTLLSPLRPWVQSLVRELRSLKPCGVAKRKSIYQCALQSEADDLCSLAYSKMLLLQLFSLSLELSVFLTRMD